MRFHLLLLLTACETTRISSLATSDDSGSSSSETEGDARWFATVQGKIAAESRAITFVDGAFRASLPMVGLSAQFDEGGAAVADADGLVVSLRTLEWGREDDLRPFSGFEPRLGACTAERDVQDNCVRRLEVPDAEVTEWWVGLGTGIEQGWTLNTAPGGHGLLVFQVAVEGALSLEAEGDGARFVDASGGTWLVDGVVAWDANGDALPAWLVVDGLELRIEVDDTEAVYPIEVDPSYTTSVQRWTGEATMSGFGVNATGADVNGDGFSDVIIAADGANGDIGRVYVYHGSASGPSATANSVFNGVARGYRLGGVVARAGDVNGDGYEDVLIIAQAYQDYSGMAYLYHGSPSGLTVPTTTIAGTTRWGYFGNTADSAGDINGDGYDDVIIGTQQSRAHVFLGSPSGISSTADITFTASGDQFGKSVAGAGDVNGDGFDDVIVGRYDYDGYRGAAHLYYGSGVAPYYDDYTSLEGLAGSNSFGYSVSGAGDIDGDGFDDVIVGAYEAENYAGVVYAFRGSSTGVETTAFSTIIGSEEQYLGARVTEMGDVDSDGFDDIAC